MAEDNPELQTKLQELDHELEEGDITQKGYQKRRTLLLSQYLGAPHLGSSQGALRPHGNADPPHASIESSRSASLAALSAHSGSESVPQQHLPQQAAAGAHGDGSGRTATALTDGSYGYESARGSLVQYTAPPPGRPAQLEIRNPVEPRPAAQGRDSLFLPGPQTSQYTSSRDASREPTMTGNYAFNPSTQGAYGDQSGYAAQEPHDFSRQSTLLDSQQRYFQDFAGQQGYEQTAAVPDTYGGGPHRYSSSDAFSPTAAMAPPMMQSGDFGGPATLASLPPLEPRDVPFAVFDPHNGNIPMSKFDNIAAVLRHRGKQNPKQPAFWVLDAKGKEIASITYEKLLSRAEKVAQVIRDKSNLYSGDRVALIYRETEVTEFAVALLGCFIAGVVSVPINQLEDYAKLNVVLTSTQAHLALTTDNNLKAFQRDITTQKLNWPRGVEWWKTNDFGSFHPKKKDDMPPLSVPDLAYIEFTRAPTGDLRGVVMSHRTIMHQMACLSAVVSCVPANEGASGPIPPGLRDKNGKPLSGIGAAEIILSYLDPRQGIGLILGILLTVYGGHTAIWMENKAVDTPGLYANIITKYKTTLMVTDYPGLKRAVFNYQTDPMTTRNYQKKFEPNFSSVKLCMIDTLTVDTEFHEVLADRWFRPLRNTRARDVVAPMLCLPEHGGMVISMRDWLGGEEHMGTILRLYDENGESNPIVGNPVKDDPSNGYGSLIGGGGAAARDTTRKGRSELMEVLLDREALKTNEIIVLATGEEASKRTNEPGAIRVGAFGYPVPDATLAIVDPESSALCPPYVVGEIWVDSPSLSGGFWALPTHTANIFHARPYRFEADNPTPMLMELEFLRTGLLGAIIEGKIFVLGLYEDRLRQKVEWVEHGMDHAEYRYFFVQHLIVTIMKNVPKIYDCSAFDVHVNDEHLPIILLESPAASTQALPGGVQKPLDNDLLDSISERCMEILYQEHHVRTYCVMITAPSALPRVVKNGRKEIGNMLCRRDFENGSLPCVHVKFGVERAVLNLPIGLDPVGGIWSKTSTISRQESLRFHEKQYSGVDYREVVIDDRTSTPLNNFHSIVDLLQWRVARQMDELSYCTVDGRGKEGKGITWKKFDIKISSVAMYLKNKVKVKPGDRMILMYTHSEDFVYAIHACFCLGLVAIPMAPLDANRLGEDAPAYLTMIKDFGVKAILVNAEVNELLKQKTVSSHLKQAATYLKTNIPPTYNTGKPPKQSLGCRDLGLSMETPWLDSSYPVLIWTYWTPDQRRVSVQLGHNTIMGVCKVQKETCQMTSSRPVLGCVRSTSGLGFVHSCLMGVFVGAPTYLVSPVDFAANPLSLFLTLSRYNVKDTYTTSQMLDHAMNSIQGKGFVLRELKNLMVSTEGRPRVDVFQKVRLHFAATGLDRTAINTVYSHVLNPMIASRSYMCIEPIELWLDKKCLRRGLVQPVDPDIDPTALLIQDSGMVPVSTQISIVNPESCRLCHIGEYGEIWVQSDACVRSFYGSKDKFDEERFNGHTVDGDVSARYVRTGDLGFLHNVSRPIGPNGALVEMQVLFVLGGIGETFEIHGLSHFPMDIEGSVEKCHRNITPGGSAIFQAGGLVVLVVEVFRKAYLASLVPILVNAILSEHQVVVDIISFVPKGEFPRSRLGEKQRGKVLASWVTRKLTTIAQFAIRDADMSDSQIAEDEEIKSVYKSSKNGITPADSFNRSSTNVAGMALGGPGTMDSYAPLPTGVSEMPATYDESTVETPTGLANTNLPGPHDYHFELPAASLHYAERGADSESSSHTQMGPSGGGASRAPQINVPLTSATGGESFMPSDQWLYSVDPEDPNGPDVAKSGASHAPGTKAQTAEGESWPEEAIMHMNLAAPDDTRRPNRLSTLPSPHGREAGQY